MQSTSRTSGGALVKTSVQLAPDQVAAINVLAASKRTRPGAVIRELIDLGLRAQQSADARLAEAVA